MVVPNNNQKNLRKFELKLKFNLQTIIVWLMVGFLVLFSFLSFSGVSPQSQQIPLSQVITDIKDNKVSKVEVAGNKLTLTYKDNKVFTAQKDTGEGISQVFKDAGLDPTSVSLEVKDLSASQAWLDILSTILPLLLMAGFFLFIIRQARGAQDSIFSFGQSRAKVFDKGRQSITFADVAGVDEAKRELIEVVDFLKHPGKYRALGARTPKGVLLVGPSGCGKCVIGDTWLSTNRGVLRIADIPKYFTVKANGQISGAEILAIDPQNGKEYKAIPSHWYDLGESKTFRIKTKEGHEIEGTPEHPLLTVSENGDFLFRPISTLKKGDWLVMRMGDEIFGNWRKIDTEDAYVFGLLTGDGGLTIKDRICFTTAEPDLATAFNNYFLSKFNYLPKKTKSRKYDWFVSSRMIRQQIFSKGLVGGDAGEKQIPETVLLAPKEIVVAYLQGLFDTDGAFEKVGRVEYSTTSRVLGQQVSALLLNLGIYHTFLTCGLNQHGFVFRLLISGHGLRDFIEKVNFRLEKKRRSAEEYIKKHPVVNTNIRVFPYQGAKAKLIWEELKREEVKPFLHVESAYHKNLCRWFYDQRGPSLSALRKFVVLADSLGNDVHQMKEFNFLRLLSKGKYVFSQVRSIKEGKDRVYDFTVPKLHSFVAGGFINHNTLLAKAVAGEAGVPFFSMAGSEFMEMLVGVGASRVRDLFSTAKKTAPSIIFIDEIDAIGRVRGAGLAGGHDEREQTLNQILVEMDGFTPNDNVIIISATNRGDLLDSALLRPGRFDRRVVVDLPDLQARLAILKIHARGKPFDADVSWETVAKRTVGYSGADLENILNEAAISAAREERKLIKMDDINEAGLKVKLGPAKKRIQTEEDKKLTAYHEAGHALVTYKLPHMDPVSRISIVARGVSLGHTLIPPIQDRTHETKSRLLDQITAMLGGRAAEQLVFNELTTGAANDIEQATRIARSMVVDFGMSKLGPVNLGPQVEYSDMGRAMWMEPSQLSPQMAAKVDNEVKRIIDEGFDKALATLKAIRKKLDSVATTLLERETLEQEEFEKLMKK